MVAKYAPKLGVLLGYKILANPFSLREYRFKAVNPSNEHFIDTTLGKVILYHFAGGQRHLLLTHGWADTSKSFQTIIKKLLDTGYSVWSIDHIGHGKSEGNLSHAVAFIDGIACAMNFIEKKYGPLYGLIAHSMGGIAVLNQPNPELINKKIVIMAVPFHFLDTIYKIIDQIGISKKIFRIMIKDIENTHNVESDSINLHHHSNKFTKNVLFIHDKDDEHCSYKDLNPLVTESKSQLYSTQGKFHRGSFKDEACIEEILKFLKP